AGRPGAAGRHTEAGSPLGKRVASAREWCETAKMAYAHIPLPPVGRLETVAQAQDTIFNWDYEIERPALLNLYEKGKRLQWNAATDIDWSVDVDPERFPDFMPPEAFNSLLNPPRTLEVKAIVELRVQQLGWMLSQFLHGEQGALLATAQIVNTVPWTEAKFYAANQ